MTPDTQQILNDLKATNNELRERVKELSVDDWAELHRLRAAVQGPAGYATWQDAATDERIRRVKAEDKITEQAETIMLLRVKLDVARTALSLCSDPVCKQAHGNLVAKLASPTYLSP